MGASGSPEDTSLSHLSCLFAGKASWSLARPIVPDRSFMVSPSSSSGDSSPELIGSPLLLWLPRCHFTEIPLNPKHGLSADCPRTQNASHSQNTDSGVTAGTRMKPPGRHASDLAPGHRLHCDVPSNARTHVASDGQDRPRDGHKESENNQRRVQTPRGCPGVLRSFDSIPGPTLCRKILQKVILFF